MKILVIGGGAAGMMAAISAADKGAQVIIAEKNEKLGKKLFITGKGRCNITNDCAAEDFFDNVISNPRFLYSSVYSFDPSMMCSFLEDEGLRLKTERGQRVFPESDKSGDVIKTLEKALRKRHVQIRLNTQIESIVIKDGLFCGANVRGGGYISADAVIIATGGISYRSTGSTGDGYIFAQKTGHRVVSQEPSLVPLVVKDAFIRELEGLSLRNISIKMDDYEDFGEMLFTSDGVSGPVILSASAYLCRKIAASEEMILHIDLKPALDRAKLDARLVRDFSEVPLFYSLAHFLRKIKKICKKVLDTPALLCGRLRRPIKKRCSRA